MTRALPDARNTIGSNTSADLPTVENDRCPPLQQLERSEFSARFRASFKEPGHEQDQSLERWEEKAWQGYRDVRQPS